MTEEQLVDRLLKGNLDERSKAAEALVKEDPRLIVYALIHGLDGVGDAKRLQTIFNQPKQPEPGEYTPAEVNRGPGDTPWYDKLTRWAYSQDPFDVKTDAAELENIFNQQAKTFPSGVDENAFAEGIQRYYAEVTTYLQANAPEFYDQRFKPFYDLRIKPNFG